MKAAKSACALVAVLGASLVCSTAIASMGSLAPRQAGGSVSSEQQWLTDQRTGCRALDPAYAPGDAISWQGQCVSGMASGSGTLSFVSSGGGVIETVTATFVEGALAPGRASAQWSNGDKYDGGQVAGQFDGDGRFESGNGDRMEGQWKNGALNGNARVLWANGDRYDGDWAKGEADGDGTEIWANGDRYQGVWQNGKPLGPRVTGNVAASVGGAATAPTVVAKASPRALGLSEPAGTRSSAQNGGAPYPLHDLLDQKLVTVDGSMLSFNQTEGGLIRTTAPWGGSEEQLTFTFITDHIGTVSDDSGTVGVFRTSRDEFDTDYADGDTETMKRDSGGGLLVALHTSDGDSTCTVWYPEGHSFSQQEKKNAVQQYALRLGVPDVTRQKKRSNAQGSCSGSPANAASADAGSSRSSAPKDTTALAAQATQVSAGPSEGRPAPSPASGGLQNVSVRDAPVHMVDTTPDPPAQFVETSLSKLDAPASGSVAQSAVDFTNATECLSVGSDGRYWGFRNRCTNAVQFAYCEMNNNSPLTSCGRTSVSGSVAANGFSPLVNDKSLSEQRVDHEFRWMACVGGAGEVVAHLDSVDPPGGTCMRAVSSSPATPGGS